MNKLTVCLLQWYQVYLASVASQCYSAVQYTSSGKLADNIMSRAAYEAYTASRDALNTSNISLFQLCPYYDAVESALQDYVMIYYWN